MYIYVCIYICIILAHVQHCRFRNGSGHAGVARSLSLYIYITCSRAKLPISEWLVPCRCGAIYVYICVYMCYICIYIWLVPCRYGAIYVYIYCLLELNIYVVYWNQHIYCLLELNMLLVLLRHGLRGFGFSLGSRV